MRYGDGGGLNAAGRQRREQIRLRAAELFEQGMNGAQVAAVLEVSTKAAYQWRRTWRTGGVEALASRGAPGPDPVVSDLQLARLRERLDAGPAAAGYVEDQRWTLVRVAALITSMFGIQISVTTTWQVLHRMGYTKQLPIHRATERDEGQIVHWRRYQWPALKESPAG